jgi:chemotaxis signal transduction protein
MTNWKGVDFEGDLARIVRHMPEVETYRESLQTLQAVWDNLTVLGQLSGTGTEITGMRAAFAQLTGTLLNSLATESRRKVAEDLSARAQVSIDILVRNLFERTADIGFLATDSDLCAYAEAASEGAGMEDEGERQRILARFREYVAKYSVYADILLLDRHGRVLCQLDETHPVTQAGDPLLHEALTSDAAYVEYYGPTDLRPGAPALIYAWRVCPAGRSEAVGVLCLVFRFHNECERIFQNLRTDDDWAVITLLDAHGVVMASSDPWQVPVGAPLDADASAPSRVLRFAGREYLAATRSTRGYQGYFGPGWQGHVMVPVEYAFETPAARALENIPPAVLGQVMDSPALFSEALQLIPRQAEAIQRELNRAVWNGNVRQSCRQGRAAQGINASFSKTLLWEISNTGARTKDIFERSIANLHETVVTTILRDCAARAGLAIDIMDRNLYERANDCRWWALSTAIRNALASTLLPAEAAARLTPILRTINGLYTVYSNLILFDADGRVLAVSDPEATALVGRTLGDEWVARTLALDNPQAYCVSDFTATHLYAGRPTYIYGAAVRDPVRSHRVVGGIAIVFDSAPQLAAMLADCLPEAAPDDPHAGIAVFVGPDGLVIASAGPDAPALGSRLDLPAEYFELPPGASCSGIVAHGGRLHAVAARMSAGYREYKGPDDAYRNDVVAVVLIPLTDADESTIGHTPSAARSGVIRHLKGAPGDVTVELATFHIGGSWYGMHSSDIVESIDIQRITTLPGLPAHVRGCVMYEGDPIMVVDLRDYVHGERAGTPSQIVIVRGATNGQRLGLLVDELGEIPEVPVSLIQPVAGLFQGSASLVDSIVKTDAGQGGELLLLLSADKLSARLGDETGITAG